MTQLDRAIAIARLVAQHGPVEAPICHKCAVQAGILPDVTYAARLRTCSSTGCARPTRGRVR